MEEISYPYLNSLDWLAYEEKEGLLFESENDEYSFAMYTLEKKDFFGKTREVIPYLSVVKKKNNICVYKTSEKIFNLWNNLVKDFYSERKILFKVVEDL